MDLIITILPVVTKKLPISPRFTPYDFLSRCKFSNLTTRQPMVEFYLLTFPRFPLRKKEHKFYVGRNQTHDFRTSRCAGYLLDHSGDEENSRQAMNSSKSVSTSDLSSKFNHDPFPFFFINLSHSFHFPRYPLCVLPPTDGRTRDSTQSATSALIPPLPSPVPDKPRGSGWEDESLNIRRASVEPLHGRQVNRSCHYLPQHVVVTRSNVFGLQHSLAEAFPSRPDRLFRPVVGIC